MKIILEHEVLRLFPKAGICGVVVNHIETLAVATVSEWKSKALRSVVERNIQLEQLTAEAEVSEWRETYRKFGVKPSENRSSVEQLLRRAVKGSLPEAPVPFVNLYCYISTIARVPMGAYDMAKLRGDVRIRLSREGEEFSGLGGQTIKSPPRVVVYSDDMGIICWAWNYRDSSRTCIDPESGTVLVFADSAKRESRSRAKNAIALLSQSLESSGCSISTPFVLDGANPEINLT